MCLLMLAISGVQAEEVPKGVPTLAVSVSWPEQAIETNVIHKTRVPRGGTLDVVATVDLTGAKFWEWDRPRIEIAASGKLRPAKVLLDGVERQRGDAPVMLAKKDGPQEVRWHFTLPWTLREAESLFTFDVKVGLPGQYGDLAKSVSVEHGVSCYDTTLTERLKTLAQSEFCRLETIGKSSLGREMYFLRVTDFAVPARDKVQFIMIGAYHGNEPSGHESILDFVHELTTKPENRRYLRKCTLYIVPCMNPDGREAGWHLHPSGIDMNNCYEKGKEVPEGTCVAAALLRYKGEFTRAIGVSTHQWRRPYLLLSHDCKEKHDWSDRLTKDVGIRISNEMDEYVHVQSGPPRYEPYTAIRGFIYYELDMPSFVLEDAGGMSYNVGRLMKSIVRELAVYYAVLDQLIEPATVRPKPRPPQAVTFPDDRNYRAYKVDTPPKIDGKLDEACWREKSIITGFTTGGARSRQEGKTTVHVVYDDRNLYVAYEVPDLQPSKITGHDPSPGVWTEDGCDFTLDTNLNRWSYFQFQANANGAFADGYWPIPGIPDSGTFNVKGYEVAGSAENGVIEIRIPFAAFNGHPEMVDAEVESPPRPGTVWGVNFMRNLPSTSWAQITTDDGGAHAPWRFNAMTFMGPRK